MTTATNPGRLLSPREVCELLSISERHRRRLERAGQFPEPDFRFKRAIRWKVATIERFVARGGLQEQAQS